MTFYFWCILVLSVSFSVCSVLKQRKEQGYSRGFMSNCPGSTKPATIPRSQLKYLNFVVQGKGQTRQQYTYWNAKNIAKDPRIKFKSRKDQLSKRKSLDHQSPYIIPNTTATYCGLVVFYGTQNRPQECSTISIRKTMVIALGYLDNPKWPIGVMFANEYEARGYNIILVDNQRFATVHYHLASRLMRPVGKHVAEVLAQLTDSGLDPAKLELLGFSLGGQTVSYIARNYQLLTGKNISKITALEPAGVCFRNLGPRDRLDSSNADFVQVIHTNIDGFGMASKMGHVDFYVNGGEYQPSDLTFYPCTITCSHFRVIELWISALKNPSKFIAIKCDSVQHVRDADCFNRFPLETNVMDLGIDRSKHGIFYLSTDFRYPYYLGENGLKPEFVCWNRITNINDGNTTEIFT